MYKQSTFALEELLPPQLKTNTIDSLIVGLAFVSGGNNSPRPLYDETGVKMLAI